MQLVAENSEGALNDAESDNDNNSENEIESVANDIEENSNNKFNEFDDKNDNLHNAIEFMEENFQHDMTPRRMFGMAHW